MDKYFCKECIYLWFNHEYMLCCPGCVAHRDKGWDTDTLMTVYQPMIALAGRAYFPALARDFPPPDRLPFALYDTYGVDQWLEQQDFLPGFVDQQKEFLKQYRDGPSKEHWDALDPFVQHRLERALTW